MTLIGSGVGKPTVTSATVTAAADLENPSIALPGIISPEQRAAALLELRKRQRIKDTLQNLSFSEYITKINPTYVMQPFHSLLAQTLEKVLRGEILRLMIWSPPQHGKSESASVSFPTYWLGMRPDDPVILASYGSDLADSKSQQARNIAESAVYRQLFPHVRVSKDSRAQDHWKLQSPHRGSMKAVGTLGAVTGNGARLGIIDDPTKNWQDANSPSHQRNLLEWYRGVFRTRIWENGAIVVIMTRWGENDLSGQLLNLAQSSEDTDMLPWHVLRLPAIAESQQDRDLAHKRLKLPTGQPDPLGRQEGEALAPGLFSIQALRAIKSEVGKMVWTTEYMSNPLPSEGNMFKREWFEQKVYPNGVPRGCKRVRYWDKAASESDGACRTAGVLMALDEKSRTVYIEDVVFGRWTPHKREEKIKNVAEQDAIRYGGKHSVLTVVEQEPGSGGKESADNTVKNLMGYRVKKDRPTGNKDFRMQPFQSQCEALNVVMVIASWNDEYLNEITAIPNGVYRDMGDASSGSFNILTQTKKTGSKAATKSLYTSRGIK